MACSASSFNKYVRRAYSLPGTMLAIGEKMVKSKKCACPGVYSSEEIMHTQIVQYDTVINTTMEGELGPRRSI